MKPGESFESSLGIPICCPPQVGVWCGIAAASKFLFVKIGMQAAAPICRQEYIVIADAAQTKEVEQQAAAAVALICYIALVDFWDFLVCAFAFVFTDVFHVALNFRDTLVFDEFQTSALVTTTLSPSKGPRVAFQAKATPRVDVAEVPSAPSSQQALCVKSCFEQFPGSFGDDTPGSLVTPSSGLSFMLVTLSGKTLTMNEDPGILVSELLDKIAGLSALPTSAFYLTFGHTCLHGADTLKSAGVQRDSLLRMRGRLLGGAARVNRNFQVPGSWHCSFCNMGGCWPGRDRCFRCNTPRYSNARRPPRESHFPGRPVQHGVSREPTVRVSRPQPAPKSGPRPSPAVASQSASASPPGDAQAVLKALKGLGLPDALFQQVHQSLTPAPKPFTSKHRQLAHLEEQVKALKNRIQRQNLALERHREQGERMQEKLLNMQIEEDKLKEEYKVLQNTPPSQSSSRPGSPKIASAGTTPLGSEDGDAPMDDSFGPLPSDDDGEGVNFVENEDSSKRARVDPTVPPPVPPAPHDTAIAMMNKALGDRKFPKKEARKLRRQLDLFLEEDHSDAEDTTVLFQQFETQQDELSLL